MLRDASQMKLSLPPYQGLYGIRFWQASGESSFDQELLNEMLKECKEDVETLSGEITAAEKKIAELETIVPFYKAEYEKALSWVDLYGDSSIEGKKMIIRQLIKKISTARQKTSLLAGFFGII